VKPLSVAITVSFILLMGSCSGTNNLFFNKSKIDYKALWQYSYLSDTINGIMINHYPAKAFCGTSATASLSIIKVGNDTIRLLDLCNMNKIDTGKNVTIFPAEKPQFNVSLPSNTATFMRNDTIYEMPSEFDLKIVRTMWGQIQ